MEHRDGKLCIFLPSWFRAVTLFLAAEKFSLGIEVMSLTYLDGTEMLLIVGRQLEVNCIIV